MLDEILPETRDLVTKFENISPNDKELRDIHEIVLKPQDQNLGLCRISANLDIEKCGNYWYATP
jgi:hypothetical protein